MAQFIGSVVTPQVPGAVAFAHSMITGDILGATATAVATIGFIMGASALLALIAAWMISQAQCSLMTSAALNDDQSLGRLLGDRSRHVQGDRAALWAGSAPMTREIIATRNSSELERKAVLMLSNLNASWIWSG